MGINELKKEILSLKDEIETLKKKKKDRIPAWFSNIYTIINEHWGISTFIFTIIIGVLLKLTLDYFSPIDEYWNKRDAKLLTKSYNKIATQMLYSGELNTAKYYFKKALELTPNDRTAFLGIEKVEIFDPPTDEQNWSNSFTEHKISALQNNFPEDEYLIGARAQYHMSNSEYDKAEHFFIEALNKNPNISVFWLDLSWCYNKMKKGPTKITNCIKKALENDSLDALIHNNLGFHYSTTLDFKNSLKHLKKSIYLQEQFHNYFNIGNTYRYINQADSAIYYHSILLNLYDNGADSLDKKYTRFYRDEMLANFMPKFQGDTLTFNQFLTTNDRKLTKALLFYTMCLDYIQKGDANMAQIFINKALKYDTNFTILKYYKNQLYFMVWYPNNQNSKRELAKSYYETIKDL